MGENIKDIRYIFSLAWSELGLHVCPTERPTLCWPSSLGLGLGTGLLDECGTSLSVIGKEDINDIRSTLNFTFWGIRKVKKPKSI